MKRLLAILVLALAPALAAQTSTIESTFQGGFVISNSNPPPAATIYFDVMVVNPMIVTQLDVRTNTSSGLVGALDVYTTPTSANGVEQNAAVWTLVGTCASAAAGNPTVCLMDTPFVLQPGTYGIALHHVSLNPVYTNPTTANPPLPFTFSNADITLDFTFGRVRRSLVNDPFGGGTNGWSPRMGNVRLHYTTATHIVDFSSDVTGGASPLTVQFRDHSASTQPGGILVWAWDFDNDGNIDSQLQHPTYVYQSCGTYTVTLTMVDSAGPHVLTKTNYIETDIVTPGFTTQWIPPETLQFLDTSSPTPTSWDWDLDGDGVSDSTLQNPVFTYPAGSRNAEVDVSLTVTRLCQPSVTLNKRIAVTQMLETRFNGGTYTSASATGGANFFDLSVLNPQGIVVSGMHVHSHVAVGGPLTINVHVTPLGYAGKERTPDDWRLIASAATTSRGYNDRTFVTFPNTYYLPAGSYGVCVEHIGHSPHYNSIGTTQTFSNADLSLTAGATMGEPVFGATASLWSPRIWNGAFYYTTCSLFSEAGYGFFEAGCAGALGVPGNTASTLPQLNGSLTMNFDNLPQDAAFFMMGFSRTTSRFGALPLDLTAFGAPGCWGNVSPDTALLIVGSGGTASLSVPILNIPNLLCTQFYTQALVLDGAANNLGAVLSDASAGIIGQ